MKLVSILNHVLGPVMRGPSSSHTAGAFHLGLMMRSLAEGLPRCVVIAFDPSGSYAQTYAAQGADRGFAMGLMGKDLTDDSFFSALEDAPLAGLELRFEIRPLDHPEHPNQMEIELTTDQATHSLVAQSVGGGEVEIIRINGWTVHWNGAYHEGLVDVPEPQLDPVLALLKGMENITVPAAPQIREEQAAIPVRSETGIREQLESLLQNQPGLRLLESTPVYHVCRGPSRFASGAELLRLASENRSSLGALSLEYESTLLGLSHEEVLQEMLRRYDIMVDSIHRGLEPDFSGLQLLNPSAGRIFQAASENPLSVGGPHSLAAARAMAVMHVDAAMGVVCAAPTGGSAGVIPGALFTLAEERGLGRQEMALALLAAGAIGTLVARRATFAAEMAGCQVEIGASGAMAAAAVVDALGGSARQALDAAAIALQNTMGMVCDLVHGMVEIPCHTRNAVAAANAFVNADLVLGGYHNPIPLDETVDAMMEVGAMMPSALRCTSRGGIAVTPSALALKPRCCGRGCS